VTALAPRAQRHVGRVAAVALVLVLGAGSTGAWAARSPAPPSSRPIHDQVVPQDTAELVQGDDACAVLTDDEILRATGGSSIMSRTPGTQDFLPAGCFWEVEDDDGFLAATVTLGIATQGGRQHYDTMVPFDDVGVPVPGVGEEASDLGFGGILAVEGDTAVSISASGMFGSRPSSLVSRALGWVALTRLVSAPALLAEAALAGPGVLPTDQPSVDAVAAIRAGEFGEGAVEATIDVLSDAGIEVVDPASGAPLASIPGEPWPLRLMEFQARSLALEAWAGNGTLGSALDEVLPVPDDAPLTSSVLAAWLAAVDTPNARLARALMSGQDVTDPTLLSFPALALLLFSDDIIEDTEASPAPRQATGGSAFLAAPAVGAVVPPIRTAQLDPCGAAQGFLDGVISTVFGVLKLPTPGNVAGAVVVSMWNWLVSRGEAFVRAAAEELGAPIIGFIRTVAGAIALVGQFVSVAQVYTVSVNPSQASIILPVAPAPAIEGFFQAIVLTSLPDWPTVLVGCANVAKVTLPSLTAQGSPVTWSQLRFVPPPLRALLTDQAIDTALDEEETPTARRRFITTTETEEEAQGEEHVSHVLVEARVVRQDIRRAFDALKDALFGGVPEIIRDRVRGELEPHVDDILDRVGVLLDVRATGEVVITYHTEPDPTPPPPAGEPNGQPDTGSAGGAVWVQIDRNDVIQRQGGAIPDSTVVPDIGLIELYSCSGPYGPWDGVLRTGAIEHPSGQHTIVEVIEIPVAFSFPGQTGVQETLISGTVGIPIVWVPTYIDIVDMVYQFGISVDGSTMTLEGGIGSGGAVVLPIEPAPPGSCPRP
jgi:hypothetical protein